MPTAQGKAYSTPQGKAYEKYINSREWTKKRSEYWSASGRSCKVGGCESIEDLQVHHHTYARLGNERMSDLIGVCALHHQEIHQLHDSTQRKESLSRVTERVVGFSLREVRPQGQEAPTRSRKKAKRKKKTLAELEVLHREKPPATPCKCRSCAPRRAARAVGKQVSVLDTVGVEMTRRQATPKRSEVFNPSKPGRKQDARQKVLDQRAARTRAHQQAQEVARRIAASR